MLRTTSQDSSSISFLFVMLGIFLFFFFFSFTFFPRISFVPFPRIRQVLFKCIYVFPCFHISGDAGSSRGLNLMLVATMLLTR